MFLEHIRNMTVGFGDFRGWTVQTLPAYLIDPGLAVISPSSILQSLAPISHSLEELTFSYFSVETWARCQHDGSQLRLNEFSQLKKCSIPATFFFASPNADSSRSGLHMLLPRSLEELEVSLF